MPAFTLGRLAKMYGLHRSTVYEAVAKGRVSAGVDRNGQKVVDLSEAIRIWGEPPTSQTGKPDTPTPTPDTHQTAELADLLAELRLLRAEVAGLRETILLIEHRPHQEQPPLSFLDDVADIFADIKQRH